jgi:hypothetical protein
MSGFGLKAESAQSCWALSGSFRVVLSPQCHTPDNYSHQNFDCDKSRSPHDFLDDLAKHGPLFLHLSIGFKCGSRPEDE